MKLFLTILKWDYIRKISHTKNCSCEILSIYAIIMIKKFVELCSRSKSSKIVNIARFFGNFRNV